LNFFQKIWINRNAETLGLLNILASLIDFSFIPVGDCPVVVSLAIFGVQFNSLIKISDSEIILFSPNIGNPPIVISLHQFRV